MKLSIFLTIRSIVLYMLVFSLNVCSQSVSDSLRKELMNSMALSEQYWNQGNLDGFMLNYWKSDSLRFIGKSGVTCGWENTLANYKKGYSSVEIMGKLKFDIISIEHIGKDYVLMVGKWNLDRKKDKISGYFSLVWKNINSGWYIIFDHSS